MTERKTKIEVVNAIRKLAGEKVWFRLWNKNLAEKGIFKHNSELYCEHGQKGFFGVSFVDDYNTIKYSFFKDGKMSESKTLNISDMYLGHRSTDKEAVLNISSSLAVTIKVIK